MPYIIPSSAITPGTVYQPGIGVPGYIKANARALACVKGGALSSTHMLDQSPLNNGTRRTGEEGRCYTADGTDDEVNYGDIGEAIWFSGWVKLNSDDQCLFSLSNDTNTNLIVSSGVLTAGATLTLSAIKVDNVTKTASEAGVLLNDNLWHFLSCGIGDGLGGASTADDVRYFTDGTNHGSVSGFDWRFWATSPTADELTEVYSGETTNRNSASLSKYALWSKMDEQSGATSYDSSGNDLTGTITNATLATFHATQNIWSFQNQVGYNKRMYFDGVGYISIPNNSNLSLTNDIDISLKFIAEDVASQNTIISKGESESTNYCIDILNGKLRFFGYSAGGSLGITVGSFTVQNNTLYLVRCIFNGVTWNIYVNGVLEQTQVNAGTLIGNSLDLNIGKRGMVLFYGTILQLSIGKSTGVISEYVQSGNANADWTDQIGSNNGTVNGSPSNIYLPRDESDPSNDVLGNPLTYTGRRPNDFKLTGSNCVDLNGTDQAVRVSDSSAFNWIEELTVIVFAKNDNSNMPNTQIIFSKYDNGLNAREFYIGVNTEEKIIAAFGDPTNGTFEGSLISDDVVSVNDLNFYALTFKSGDAKLYFNGSLIPSTISSGSIPETLYNGTADIIFFGLLNNDVIGNYWDGQIVDLRIHTKELSESEIQSIYQDSNSLTSDSSLVGRWKSQEGAGSVVYDSSGNENHGTIENAASNWGVTQDLVHSNLREGHGKRMYFNGLSTYVNSDLGSFYSENSLITVDISIDFNKSASSSVIFSLGNDDNNGFQVLYFDTSNCYRAEFLLGGSIVSVNLNTLISGIYSFTFNKNTHSISVSLPNGSILTNNLTSTALSFRGNGFLVIGRRPKLNDKYFEGSISNFKLKNEIGNFVLIWNGYGNSDSDWSDITGNGNDGTVNGSPSNLYLPAKTSSVDIFDQPLTHPAGDYHNNAETTVDFNPDSTPEMGATQLGITVPSAHAFGDAFTASDQIFSRQRSKTEDRFLVFPEAQTGSALTNIQKYTQP